MIISIGTAGTRYIYYSYSIYISDTYTIFDIHVLLYSNINIAISDISYYMYIYIYIWVWVWMWEWAQGPGQQ